MARLELAPLTQWITAAALEHGPDLVEHLMQREQINRRRANSVLKALEAAQWLARTGTPRRPQFRPGALRQVVRSYAISGLDEQRPWRRDFAPNFELPAPVRHMAQHSFTELLNNAIEHSGGSAVTVSMRQTPLQLQLLVSDDGCGLFKRVAECFAIDEPDLAMLELGKGKLTTAPEHHSGHGLFFSAQLADVIDIHANGVSYQRRAWEPGQWHAAPQRNAAAARPGTAVYLAIQLDTGRTLDGVLQAHSASGCGYDFARTRVPLSLLCGSDSAAALLSRADARRAAQRLAEFEQAEIDFCGIDHLGHGFADELFRVLPRQHPGLTLHPVGMAPQVAAMVASVRGTIPVRQRHAD
jgi:anti-sigma regulatory factor (Ser/Thr protein kinase)